MIPKHPYLKQIKNISPVKVKQKMVQNLPLYATFYHGFISGGLEHRIQPNFFKINAILRIKNQRQ
jgi:hypothetical protein